MNDPPSAHVRPKPDILDCLANLSNDEVFTPPKLAAAMLDELPASLWENPAARFLDPFCKSGVFLREIAKRLDRGLARAIPDREARLRHILGKQVYGIAITRLTSLFSRRTLYCNKDASGPRAEIRDLFASPEGLVLFKPCNHRWERGSCALCGASAKVLGRGAERENYAYPFLHSKEYFKMAEDLHFDLVIGNPPYQTKDGGAQASATPIYNRFVEQAMELNPRYLSMIIPARWYSGGKGLDEFRERMIHDRRIRILHDVLDAAECFGTGVEVKGGVCYFLWDRDHEGPCEVRTQIGGNVVSKEERELAFPGSDIFVRRNESISILEKVEKFDEVPFSNLVSPRKPFGLATVVETKANRNTDDAKVIVRGGTGFISRKDVLRNRNWIDRYKVFISKAYNAGDDYPHQILNKPILGEPGTCCSETYLVIGPFGSKTETENVMSYIRTKFFRFLVSPMKISQDATQRVYSFVPQQDFSKPWTDEELFRKYGLTKEERAFVEKTVRPME